MFQQFCGIGGVKDLLWGEGGLDGKGTVNYELDKLHASRIFAPSHLHALLAFRAFLTLLIYASCAPFPRALCPLFVPTKIFLRWICSPARTFYFPKTVKGTLNNVVFMWVKKQPRKFNAFVFSFSSFQQWSNKSFSLK